MFFMVCTCGHGYGLYQLLTPLSISINEGIELGKGNHFDIAPSCWRNEVVNVCGFHIPFPLKNPCL